MHGMSVSMLSARRELCFLSAASVSAVAGAVWDLRQRRVPNVLTCSSLVFGLALHGFVSGAAGAASAAYAAGIAGSIFLLLYLAGGLGAGDVKLMAAVTSIGGLGALHPIFEATVISGAVIAVAVAIYHRQLRRTLKNAFVLADHHWRGGIKPHESLNMGGTEVLRMPFAVPIAIGCVSVLVLKMMRG